MELLVLQFVPIAPCPVPGHRRQEPGPVLLAPALKVSVDTGKVPSQPSPLQAEQPQLPQPVPIRETLQPLVIFTASAGPSPVVPCLPWTGEPSTPDVPSPGQSRGAGSPPSPCRPRSSSCPPGSHGPLGPQDTLLARGQLAPPGTPWATGRSPQPVPPAPVLGAPSPPPGQRWIGRAGGTQQCPWEPRELQPPARPCAAGGSPWALPAARPQPPALSPRLAQPPRSLSAWDGAATGASLGSGQAASTALPSTQPSFPHRRLLGGSGVVSPWWIHVGCSWKTVKRNKGR